VDQAAAHAPGRRSACGPGWLHEVKYDGYRMHARLVRPKSAAAGAQRENRFGSPLELSRENWVHPEVVVEVTYLTWTEGGLPGAVSYQGQREDKPARQVVRAVPQLWPPIGYVMGSRGRSATTDIEQGGTSRLTP
jgi:bifunctional non-homologous end joining protein LigD